MKPEILLKAYVRYQSEDAFRELVATFLDEVYSSAFRIVQGASHLAEETALRVFWELHRKAPRLAEEVELASWLRERTCRTAAIVLREDGRSVDRSALKREMQGISTPNSVEAVPRGLATRIWQGVLLNAARHKGFRRLSGPVLWPAWIRFKHIRVTSVCLLVIAVVWNLPFHRSNPIVQSEGVQLTPASFAQLGSAEDGEAPAAPRGVGDTKTEAKPNEP